jgi:hypothetical protein
VGVALSDDELVHFDQRVNDYDASRARLMLEKQRAVFRPQLVMAKWIDGWRERQARRSTTDHHPPEWHDGFDRAAREMSALLRQGEFLPGHSLHDETDAGKL